jgi:hypothetical protein
MLREAVTLTFGGWGNEKFENPNFSISNIYNIYATGGRTQGYAEGPGSHWGVYYFQIGGLADAELFIQTCVYNSTNWGVMAWLNGTTILGTIKINTNNNVEVYVGDYATKVLTGAQIVNPSSYVPIEIHVKIDNSVGLIELRVNGLSDGSFSGDTKPGADSLISNVKFCGVRFCDMIINDPTGAENNSWPDGGHPYRIFPSSDDTPNEMTPYGLTGSHYANINENTPENTNGLRALTSDLKEVFGLGNLPAAAKSITGAILITHGLAGSSSAPSKIIHGLNIDAVDYLSSAVSPGLSLSWLRTIYQLNPGGGAFTVTQINGSKIVLKSAD